MATVTFTQPGEDNDPLLANPADVVKDVEPGRVTGADDARLIRAIRRASSRFRDEVEHPVHRVLGDTIVLEGAGTQYVRLPVRNATVHTVTVDGVTIAPDRWTVLPTGFLRFSHHRIGRDATVEINADHGFETIPSGIQEAVADMAARIASIPIGVKQATVGTAAVTFGTDVGTTQQWAKAVERYRIGGRA